MPLLCTTPSGLYCEAGDFYIDPWRSVPHAVITHAHGDHARWGMGRYLCSAEGERVTRTRVGVDSLIQAIPYGEPLTIGSVRVSLHPAGHILGSAQVRVEHKGEVWVVSGDYKVRSDATCTPFEPVRCHTFVTESTFGLPIYRWPDPGLVQDEINAWWRQNQEEGRASVLFGYALGKSQRLLAGLDPSLGPIYCHGAVEVLNAQYRATGVALPPTRRVGREQKPADFGRAMILGPPSAQGSPWMRRFGEYSGAFASGWMMIRGTRRRRSVDRGFVVSDHADWPELQQTIEATGAENVLVTHGYVAVMVRWLKERGWNAAPLSTPYAATGEADESVEAEGEAEGEGESLAAE